MISWMSYSLRYTHKPWMIIALVTLVFFLTRVARVRDRDDALTRSNERR